MTRTITTPVSDSLDADIIQPFFAVDLDFDDEPLYVWSGIGDLVINSKTYLGAGQLLSISSVEETSEIEAKGASIVISAIPTTFLSAALQTPYQGRECRIYFGVRSSPSDYVEIFTGELDQMNILEDTNSATIEVTAENVLIKLERPVVRRFTNESQQSRYPGDVGLEFVADLQDKDVLWGRKSDNTSDSSSTRR